MSPVVILCEIGQIFVQITPNEWNTLYTYRHNVTNFIKGTGDSQQLVLSDATFMQLSEVKDNNGIDLNESEWNTLMSMMDLITTTISFYARVHDQVLQYYITYTQLCFEKRVMWLTHDNYFELDKEAKFNSTRLFNEIGFFFMQKSGVEN